MTPMRAAESLGCRVLVDEGTEWEREGRILAVAPGGIGVWDGVTSLQYVHWHRVSFAPARFTESDVAEFAALGIKAVES